MWGCLVLGPHPGLEGWGFEGPEIVTSKMYQLLAILAELKAVGLSGFPSRDSTIRPFTFGLSPVRDQFWQLRWRLAMTHRGGRTIPIVFRNLSLLLQPVRRGFSSRSSDRLVALADLSLLSNHGLVGR